MSSGASTPLNKWEEGVSKWEEGVKKRSEKMEESFHTAAFNIKSKLSEAKENSKRKKKWNKKTAVASNTVTSSTPLLSATQTSSYVQDTANERDLEWGENTIINGDEESSPTLPTAPPAQLLFIFITLISISTVYYMWFYKSDILMNQIPFIVAAQWALIAYFIGRSAGVVEKVVVVSKDNDMSEDKKAATTIEEEQANGKRTPLLRMFKAKKYNRKQTSFEEFFTNLKPAGKTAKGPISEGMMNALTKISADFKRRKSTIGEIDMTQLTEDRLLEEEEEGEEYQMGTAPLGNSRASKLVREFDYVEPMFKFRGMDFFLGEFPEKEIWKQPLLLNNGLRDAPTLIGNLMLPNGNLVSYLQMPDWFDNWDNIPEEKEDDPPDMKAFKRFFTGDLEYQRKRAKLVPMVVKAPYVVKAISPAPRTITIHTAITPVCIKKVNKTVDPVTGKTSAALMELGVDVYTSAAIGRIINIVFPHLGSITIDLALVIEGPWDPEAGRIVEDDEPSACLGVWRIDKVDFMSFAQFPEQPVEVVEKEIEDIMKSMETE